MNIKFREYKQEDKQLLLEMSKKLSEYSKSIDPMRRVINLPGFAEMDIEDTLINVKKYNGKILFAVVDGKEIGYIVGAIWKQSKKNKLEIGSHKLGEVIDLFIEEDYRRKGLGNQMLAMMENYFKKNNCDSMWVQVFAPNHPAHNLYNKFGFIDREVGMLKNI